MFYPLLRKILFQFDEEDVHDFTLGTLDAFLASAALRRTLRSKLAPIDPRLHTEVLGLSFENPLGLAAGFDTTGRHVNVLAALGFSHIEIGTITALAEPGNPRPRMFRLKKDLAILNRMGFNNPGCEATSAILQGVQPESVLGVNIGESKQGSDENIVRNYVSSFTKLSPQASYFVVNASAPMNEKPAEMIESQRLKHILTTLVELRNTQRRKLPLLVKLSPDLSEAALDETLQVVLDLSLDGVITSNTTCSRKTLKTPKKDALGEGRLSGPLLRTPCLDRVERIHQLSEGRLAIVAVGGISNAQDVIDAMIRGASLVQIWTSLIYEGPFVVQRILAGLSAFCEREKIASLDAIVGQLSQ